MTMKRKCRDKKEKPTFILSCRAMAKIKLALLSHRTGMLLSLTPRLTTFSTCVCDSSEICPNLINFGPYDVDPNTEETFPARS